MHKIDRGDKRKSRNRRIISSLTAKAPYKYLLFVTVVVMTLPKLIKPTKGYVGPLGNFFESNNGKGGGNNAKSWTIDLTEKKDRTSYQMTSKKMVKKKQELTEYQKRESADWRILFYVHFSGIIHTILLLRGKGLIFEHSSSAGVLVSSMFCTKLLTYVNNTEIYFGAGHKTFIALVSSATAYCFNSRSVERLGGVYLAFIQFMAL